MRVIRHLSFRLTDLLRRRAGINRWICRIGASSCVADPGNLSYNSTVGWRVGRFSRLRNSRPASRASHNTVKTIKRIDNGCRRIKLPCRPYSISIVSEWS